MTDERYDARLTAFGVNAETGEVDSIGLDEVRRIMAGWELDTGFNRGYIAGMNPKKLSSSGWGIVVHRDRRDAILGLLDPLLALRRKQVRRKNRFRILEYLPGDTKHCFLERHEADIDVVDPDRLPYYLLIAGTPKEIPWDFQYQLDMQYAVGRIGFDDPEAYGRYAAAVVAAEKAPGRSRRTLLFGPRHDGDNATTLASEHLVGGLARQLGQRQRRRRRWRWEVQVETGEAATRRRLIGHFGAADGPALLMTVGHGLLLRRDHPERCGSPGRSRLPGLAGWKASARAGARSRRGGPRLRGAARGSHRLLLRLPQRWDARLRRLRGPPRRGRPGRREPAAGHSRSTISRPACHNACYPRAPSPWSATWSGPGSSRSWDRRSPGSLPMRACCPCSWTASRSATRWSRSTCAAPRWPSTSSASGVRSVRR